MATFNAADLNTKPRHLGRYGNATLVWGAVTPTAGALADVYRPVLIPAGLEVTDIFVNFEDMDSGTTLAVKVGYTPVDASTGPAADDDYFSAADTFLSGTAGVKSFRFDPIKFESPVFLTFTVTAAATGFQSKKLVAKVYGDGLGIQ